MNKSSKPVNTNKSDKRKDKQVIPSENARYKSYAGAKTIDRRLNATEIVL